ncbi:hypothetical protein [Actinoplanes sp. HUAS TT8]|uniref:hypothetical protein n=1 Tax=Actinoplanes sp. HUAS TT8 TaxID=3447453 RepID=UPI003F51EED3
MAEPGSEKDADPVVPPDDPVVPGGLLASPGDPVVPGGLLASPGDPVVPGGLLASPGDPVVPADTEHGEKTQHAPLAQWAARAGGREHPEAGSPEVQAPIDPWPMPIQGLTPPPGAPSIEDLDLATYAQPAVRQRNLRVLVAVLVVAVTALVGGAIGVVARGSTGNTPAVALTTPAVLPSRDLSSGLPSLLQPSPQPSVTPSEDLSTIPPGPVPQGVPPESIYDMDQICQGLTYWPMLPKRSSTKAPHPILVTGDTGEGKRLPYTMFKAWFLKKPAALEKAWSSSSMPVSKIQMVACIDRVSVGAKVRTCTYESPGSGLAGGEATLYHATYRLHVYETATGKKIMDTKLAAKDTTCPYALGVPDNHKVYMEITDTTLAATMSKFAGV